MPPAASDADWRRMPALLTTIDTSPHVRAAFAMSSALLMSSCTGITSWFVIVVRSLAAPYTLAPDSTRASAIAVPRPRLAPVTSAAAPSIFMGDPFGHRRTSRRLGARGVRALQD